jgi:hypothetical protein
MDSYVFKLREALRQLADEKIQPEEMMAGIRTDVAELMLRDLSHTGSIWRGELPSLLTKIAKRVFGNLNSLARVDLVRPQ